MCRVTNTLQRWYYGIENEYPLVFLHNFARKMPLSVCGEGSG
jgi:hypothetical protein